MNSKRLYQVLVGLVVLAILGLFGGAYMLNKLLTGQADTLQKQRVQIAVLDGQQESLNTAKKNIEKYQSLAKVAETIVPKDKSQALTIREITNIAKAHGIVLGAYNFPSSNLGTVVGPAAALSQLSPVANIPGVFSLEIIVKSDDAVLVPYQNFIGFLKDLESNRRTTLVQSVSIDPSPEDPSRIKFNLTLQEYIKA